MNSNIYASLLDVACFLWCLLGYLHFCITSSTFDLFNYKILTAPLFKLRGTISIFDTASIPELRSANLLIYYADATKQICAAKTKPSEFFFSPLSSMGKFVRPQTRYLTYLVSKGTLVKYTCIEERYLYVLKVGLSV